MTTTIRARDLLERLFWTIVAAACTNLVGVGILDLDALQAAALAGINGAFTFLFVVARWRLSVLPDPGAGLPGQDRAATTLELALSLAIATFILVLAALLLIA